MKSRCEVDLHLCENLKEDFFTGGVDAYSVAVESDTKVKLVVMPMSQFVLKNLYCHVSRDACLPTSTDIYG